MATVTTLPDVLTLDELADYLRLPSEAVRNYATRAAIPGRRIGDDWRFSRRAIEEWLRGPTGKQALMSQAGVFKDDAEDLRQLVDSIYRDRGRLEVEENQ